MLRASRRRRDHGVCFGLALAALVTTTTPSIRADIAPPRLTRSVLPFPKARVVEAGAEIPLIAPDADFMSAPLSDAQTNVSAESVLVEIDLFPTFARVRVCLDLVPDPADGGQLEIGFPEGWTHPLHGFQVAVDGEPVDVRTIGKEPDDPARAYETRIRSTRSNAPIWKVWRVDFPARNARNIELEYLHLFERWTLHDNEGHGDLAYVLTPAALWAGPVGEILVEIHRFDLYPDKVGTNWSRNPSDPRCHRWLFEPDNGECPPSLSEPELMASKRQTLYETSWFAQSIEPEENLSVRVRSDLFKPDWWGPWDAEFPRGSLIRGPVRLLAHLGRFTRLESFEERDVAALIEMLEQDARSADPCLARPAHELLLELRDHCGDSDGIPAWLTKSSDENPRRSLREKICRWSLESRAGNPPPAAACPLDETRIFLLGERYMGQHVQTVVLQRYVIGAVVAACALLLLITVLVVRRLRRRTPRPR